MDIVMKHTHALSFLFFILLALGLTSCASVSTMQTAGVVPEGEIRWAIASTGTGGDGDTQPSADPNFEAAIRYGAAENLDIGLKINFLGAQVGAKYQFLRGDFDLSLGLEAGYQWVRSNGMDDPSSHVLAFQLPLLMEYHFNPYVGLAFGPKLLGIYVAETDERADIWNNSGFYVGLMLGLPLRLTDGVWFQPEFNVYTNAYDEAENSFSNVLWQAGVSVFFGGL
jgi:hypothetical protein